MHSYRRYSRRNAEGLIWGNDVSGINVAKCIVAESDAELVRQPVGADYALHRIGSSFFGAHSFGRIVPSAAAIAVECFRAVPAVLVTVGVIMVTDEEDASAVLHIFCHRLLLACFVRHVGFGCDEDAVTG
ncbi:hypothetical protein D3C73_1134090 [compost metagenome]